MICFYSFPHLLRKSTKILPYGWPKQQEKLGMPKSPQFPPNQQRGGNIWKYMFPPIKTISIRVKNIYIFDYSNYTCWYIIHKLVYNEIHIDI